MIPSLPALVAEIVIELPKARGLSADGVITWSVGDQPFATVGPAGVEVRLDPTIAAAAGRTPDAGPSPRGAEWVRFDPLELDGHAVDRLRAWLELAYRRAEG
ncbi:MAG TPA: hypothetical protein VMQ65_09935 [Candidatus Limnocylindria bacterium]|nr:hypothetical protein [Candidatus Limnocylindria bacterium]